MKLIGAIKRHVRKEGAQSAVCAYFVYTGFFSKRRYLARQPLPVLNFLCVLVVAPFAALHVPLRLPSPSLFEPRTPRSRLVSLRKPNNIIMTNRSAPMYHHHRILVSTSPSKSFVASVSREGQNRCFAKKKDINHLSVAVDDSQASPWIQQYPNERRLSC